MDADFFKEAMDKHFKDVKSKSPMPTPPPVVSPNTDLEQVASEFWLKYENGKHYRTYQSGQLNGTFNNKPVSIEGMNDTVLSAITNILNLQSDKENVTLESLRPYLEMVKMSFSLLEDKIHETFDKTDGVDFGEMALAYLYSSLTIYIKNNLLIEGE